MVELPLASASGVNASPGDAHDASRGEADVVVEVELLIQALFWNVMKASCQGVR